MTDISKVHKTVKDGFKNYVANKEIKSLDRGKQITSLSGRSNEKEM